VVDTWELLVHPVRLRIVHAMSGGRILTTTQLRTRLPDVPKATLYRQVALLADGGILELDGEQRVHGIVERRYRLNRAKSVIDPEAAASATTDDHRRTFAVAMAALIAEFNTYLDRDQADPAADLVGYRQHTLWLSRPELLDLMDDLRAAIVPRLGNEPTPDRTQHLLSPIIFPIEPAPQP
jgi:DNA-binding transcriptional ArsR family regulator